MRVRRSRMGVIDRAAGPELSCNARNGERDIQYVRSLFQHRDLLRAGKCAGNRRKENAGDAICDLRKRRRIDRRFCSYQAGNGRTNP